VTDFRIGTSAFTAAGWEQAFYPAGMKPADYLTYYATKFSTVEVDSTFYRTPSVAAVNGWERKTPKGFLLAAKVPQIITHEKILEDCDEDLKNYLETMDLMGDKLGPLLFQFGYFNKTAFKSGKEFLARLESFLKKLLKGYRFALEIRNKQWLTVDSSICCASQGRLSGRSTYSIEDAQLAASENRSAKTADGRMATEAAR
jgi:uncharacterized protein YecE (DUF72 family)